MTLWYPLVGAVVVAAAFVAPYTGEACVKPVVPLGLIKPLSKNPFDIVVPIATPSKAF